MRAGVLHRGHGRFSSWHTGVGPNAAQLPESGTNLLKSAVHPDHHVLAEESRYDGQGFEHGLRRFLSQIPISPGTVAGRVLHRRLGQDCYRRSKAR